MNKLSVIILSRNEMFLAKTVNSIFENAIEDIEVIVILDGCWHNDNEVPKENENLKYIHFGKARGLRAGVNAGVAVATGKYIMKTDAHCLYAKGFDKTLKEDCEYNWIVAPRRYSLDGENWTRKPKHHIDYLWCETPSEKNNFEINVRVWNEKNYDEELDKKLIDDIFTFQGSCWFMHRDYFYELDGMDEINYGSFRKEPQEISFKAWLSGGRVVRNKKTWYAHLHKGRQYGRGYSTSRTDFRKGDEYLTNWLSDSAWDKQTIPFRWMIEKFNMPGWDEFDWSKWEQDDAKLIKLYQNIPMAGVAPQNEKKNNSKFWNEGKWNNFIAPLLPSSCIDQTFVEMGCNAGLFLKLAEDKGFRNIVGVEKDRTPVQQGLRYKDQIGYKYQILKRKIGGEFGENGTFDINELPVADYTLMSTFHYYVDINSWLKYVDRLITKTANVIIVSRPVMRKRHWLARCELDALDWYFDEWEKVEYIDNVLKENDPHPRDLFTVMYKSPVLKRLSLSEIDIRESRDDPTYLVMRQFAKEVAISDNIDPFDTDFYRRWKERKDGKWSERTLRKFVKGKYDMMVNVKENGLLDPIVIDHKNRLCDGGHRLAILTELGYETVMTRRTA